MLAEEQRTPDGSAAALGEAVEKRESQEELRQMLELQDAAFNTHQPLQESGRAPSENGSLDPHQLKQQFEETEAGIIHQLYNEHFKPTGLKNLIKDLPPEDQEKLLPQEQGKRVFDGRAQVLH